MSGKALVHFIAICKDCSWSCEDYLTGQNAAEGHVKRTGHTVAADLGYVCEYSTGERNTRRTENATMPVKAAREEK